MIFGLLLEILRTFRATKESNNELLEWIQNVNHWLEGRA